MFYVNLEHNIKLRFKRILKFSGRVFFNVLRFSIKVFTSSSFFVVRFLIFLSMVAETKVAARTDVLYLFLHGRQKP